MSDAALASVRDVACPDCGPDRQSAANRVRKVRREWHHRDGFSTWYCARCGSRGHDRPGAAEPLSVGKHNFRPAELVTGRATSETAPANDNGKRDLARLLWSRSIEADGTLVEAYLKGRGIACEIPGTVRYLPARGTKHVHAMIVPFGIATERNCGRYEIAAEQVMGIHLTRLSPDGRTKAEGERAKIMLGPSKGFPLMLAPPNDGLGMAIAEGIENALSIHAATGLGAWAAGSAGRLPDMAEHVPAYVESLLIFADDDPAGMAGAKGLEGALTGRGHEIRLQYLPTLEAAHGV